MSGRVCPECGMATAVPIDAEQPDAEWYCSECKTEGAKEDFTPWPSEDDPCYDCGSIFPDTHTRLCEFSDPGDDLTLPMVGQAQWWDKNQPHPKWDAVRPRWDPPTFEDTRQCP